jgi:hypothetical protein
MTIGRGNWITWRKLAPVPVYPPQIPHGLTYDRTRVTAVWNSRCSVRDSQRFLPPWTNLLGQWHGLHGVGTQVSATGSHAPLHNMDKPCKSWDIFGSQFDKLALGSEPHHQWNEITVSKNRILETQLCTGRVIIPGLWDAREETKQEVSAQWVQLHWGRWCIVTNALD